MDYVIIDDITYNLESEEVEARLALENSGIDSVPVWTTPQSCISEAGATGYEGAYKTGGRLTATVVMS